MRSLRGFTGEGYDKGRGPAWQVMWFAVQSMVVMHWWCPGALRVRVLRAFGAQIGTGAVIRHRVRVHWPWKLTVGDNVWIGEGSWILNLEPVTIGDETCVSQDALLCTGSHRFDHPTFEFDNAPIVIGARSWVAARATVLRGVVIGDDVLIGACALVVKDVPSGASALAPTATPFPSSPREG